MFKSKHKNAGDNILVPTPTFQHFSRVLKYEYSGVFWLLYSLQSTVCTQLTACSVGVHCNRYIVMSGGFY